MRPFHGASQAARELSTGVRSLGRLGEELHSYAVEGPVLAWINEEVVSGWPFVAWLFPESIQPEVPRPADVTVKIVLPHKPGEHSALKRLREEKGVGVKR